MEKILHLTLKKKWWDMIASGEKKEEYREIGEYWSARLTDGHDSFKHFDLIKFRHGYAKNAPTLIVQCLGISIDEGVCIWGAEGRRRYYVIKLGSIITL